MQQEKIKLDTIKVFTNSLEVKEGKIYTTLDEDDYFEFKKSLHTTKTGISKQYMKTIAGLANNKGGVIIFGIHPTSQELIGIDPKHENLDNKYVNMVVSECLDGLSSFYFFTHNHDDKLLGFLVINEPIFKPVIVKSNFHTNNETHVSGDIYFRYPGEVLKIKPSDLRALMSKEISRHAQQLVKQINTLVKIGPENAAIINSKTGEVNANNSKLTLSPDILADLNLIMEGQFVEKQGAPAYVIKGNIELESGEGLPKVIREQTALHNRDYHLCLLEGKCSNPISFLKDIVYRDTFYLPVFNLISKAKITVSDGIKLLKEQNTADVKKNTKKRIIERLLSTEIPPKLICLGTIKEEIKETQLTNQITVEVLKNKYGLKGNASKTIIRTIIFNNLKVGKTIDIKLKEEYFKEYINAFSHLSKENVLLHSKFYRKELKGVLDKYTDKLVKDNSIKSSYRKVICLIDYYLFAMN